MQDLAMLMAAGLLAGAMNALAGGGSFVSLPAFVAAGVPSVSANASSTVALYPGGLASAWVYRDGLEKVGDVPLLPSFLSTVAGGLIGALLLLNTPNLVFDKILPWLLLVATLVLMLGPRLGAFLRQRFRIGRKSVLAIQFALGVYGGYFGGAVGLMMMAAWSLLDAGDVKQMAPARTLMVTGANTIAVICFAWAGAVWWMQTAMLAAGALAGGYVGAWLGKRLPARLVRGGTLVLATGMTLAFFVRAYGSPPR